MIGIWFMWFERSWGCAEESVISVWEGNFVSACLQQLVHLQKGEKKKQDGLISRSAFGRMISPKQIMVCLCHFIAGEAIQM